jgi:hypothetical protein
MASGQLDLLEPRGRQMVRSTLGCNPDRQNHRYRLVKPLLQVLDGAQK